MLTGIAVAAVLGQAAMIWGGDMSCARWQSSHDYREAGRFWILGFWSGLNMDVESTGRVGVTTDADGLVAEVRLECAARPSMAIATATTQVYRRFQAEGR